MTNDTQTAFMTTMYVSPNSFKCNVSMNNCPIALKFCTVGDYGTYGQSGAIKGKYDQIRVTNATYGKYDQIRVINATLGQI